MNVRLNGGPFDGQILPVSDPSGGIAVDGGDLEPGQVARYIPTEKPAELAFHDVATLFTAASIFAGRTRRRVPGGHVTEGYHPLTSRCVDCGLIGAMIEAYGFPTCPGSGDIDAEATELTNAGNWLGPAPEVEPEDEEDDDFPEEMGVG